MRKLLDRLTGAQITVIAVALIAALVPGSLFAVAAFTNVAIQDPASGSRARVDSTGRLQVGVGVYEPYADAYEYYRLSPYYKLTIGFSADTSKIIYTVPSNYYAVIESLTGSLSISSGYSAAGFYLYGQGHGVLTGVFGNVTPYSPVTQTFGTGYVLSPGEQLSVDSRGAGNTGLYLHGYLIPASFSVSQTHIEATPAFPSYVNGVTKGLPKTRESPP